jgi:HPt (histidine-containing phosphotransfer) domain-containing protein
MSKTFQNLILMVVIFWYPVSGSHAALSGVSRGNFELSGSICPIVSSPAEAHASRHALPDWQGARMRRDAAVDRLGEEVSMNTEGIDDISSLPELDAEWVVRDFGNDEESYRAVADMFLSDLAALRQSLVRAPGESVATLMPAIHEIANSLGVIGARRGAAQVRDAERRLRQGEALSLQNVQAMSGQALDLAEAALRAWLQGSGLEVQAPPPGH